MAIYAGNWIDENGQPFDPGAYKSHSIEAPQKAQRRNFRRSLLDIRKAFTWAVKTNAATYNEDAHQQNPQWSNQWPGTWHMDRWNNSNCPERSYGHFIGYNIRNFFWSFRGIPPPAIPPDSASAFPAAWQCVPFEVGFQFIRFEILIDQPLWETSWHDFQLWRINPEFRTGNSRLYHATYINEFNPWVEGEYFYRVMSDYPFPLQVGRPEHIWFRWCKGGRWFSQGIEQVPVIPFQ